MRVIEIMVMKVRAETITQSDVYESQTLKSKIGVWVGVWQVAGRGRTAQGAQCLRGWREEEGGRREGGGRELEGGERREGRGCFLHRKHAQSFYLERS